MSGIIFRKISGNTASAVMLRPLSRYLNRNWVPLIDWVEVELTKYFFTLGSNRSVDEYSLIPARRSTRAAHRPICTQILERTSASIYSLPLLFAMLSRSGVQINQLFLIAIGGEEDMLDLSGGGFDGDRGAF